MPHIIRGHYRADDGTIGDADALGVERRGGRWHLAGRDDPIRAESYVVASGISPKCPCDLRGVQIVSDATEAEARRGLGFAWEFLPDPGECERVGLPVLEAS